MARPARTAARSPCSPGLRVWLLAAKRLGVIAFLGGLAALTALGLLARTPTDPEGWVLRRDALRAVFFPCVFGGVMLTVGTGMLLWLRAPKAMLGQTWFRVKVVVLAVTLPGLHLWARGRVLGLYAAVDAGRVDEAARAWERVTVAFGVATIVMAGLVVFATVKPGAVR